MGAVYFIVYYFVFSFMIRRFDYPTPGRDGSAVKLYTRGDVHEKNAAGGTGGDHALSAQIVQGLGGRANISDVDCCITRLRCTVHDPAKVDRRLLGATGASGVICKGQGVQVVYGPRVSNIKSDLEAYLAAPERGSAQGIAAPRSCAGKGPGPRRAYRDRQPAERQDHPAGGGRGRRIFGENGGRRLCGRARGRSALCPGRLHGHDRIRHQARHRP